MFNVCSACGLYDAAKWVDAARGVAVCPHCRHAQPFRQLPLFVLTGASGTGKTTVCQALVDALPECVVLESDILWRPEFDEPATGYRSYREVWLRLAKNIGQNGRPVLLAGTAIPEQFESCVERRYFAASHYLALVCAPETLRRRLQQRPAWRASGTPAFIERMVQFNTWLDEHAAHTEPPMTLLDTTEQPLGQTVARVGQWVRSRLPELPGITPKWVTAR